MTEDYTLVGTRRSNHKSTPMPISDTKPASSGILPVFFQYARMLPIHSHCTSTRVLATLVPFRYPASILLVCRKNESSELNEYQPGNEAP